MLQQALEYQARGWSVLPIQPHGKRPLLKSWTELQTKAADPDDLKAWWSACPDANVGVVTGRVSGVVVVDLDGGDADADEVMKELGADALGPVSLTGKGQHVWFRHPGGEVKNGARIARVGDTLVDIRGDGGFVCAPPSLHENGNRYQWLTKSDYLPLLPEVFRREAGSLLLNELPTVGTNAPKAGTAADIVATVTGIDRLLKGVGAGERNDASAKVAGYFLRACHGNETAALAALQGWNALNHPPLGERELRTTFDSICRRHRLTGEYCEAAVEREPGLDGAVPKSRLTLLSGHDWATAVRDIPPRHGTACPSWPGLDEVGGLVPKDFLVLAGRPGMGKSTAAWGVVLDACIRQQLPSLIFSTEMTAVDVARWIGSMRYGVHQDLLSEKQWHYTLDALSGSPVTICDAAAVSVTDIVKAAESMPATKLVIIDHIQRLKWGETRHTAIAEGCAMLKSLAKDNDLTVAALAQLNRSSAYEKRQPQLHDLKESGGLEEEADAVCFIWTDQDDTTQVDLPVKFWWAKNRHGRLCQRDAIFHKVTKRYEAIDECIRLRDVALQAQHISQTHKLLGERED
jgi:KaiC/GvpD/RAD55 family RecA-like ATPase